MTIEEFVLGSRWGDSAEARRWIYGVERREWRSPQTDRSNVFRRAIPRDTNPLSRIGDPRIRDLDRPVHYLNRQKSLMNNPHNIAPFAYIHQMQDLVKMPSIVAKMRLKGDSRKYRNF